MGIHGSVHTLVEILQGNVKFPSGTEKAGIIGCKVMFLHELVSTAQVSEKVHQTGNKCHKRLYRKRLQHNLNSFCKNHTVKVSSNKMSRE